MWESTDSHILLVLRSRGWREHCNSSKGDRQRFGRAPPCSACWAENAIITECTQECCHLWFTFTFSLIQFITEWRILLQKEVGIFTRLENGHGRQWSIVWLKMIMVQPQRRDKGQSTGPVRRLASLIVGRERRLDEGRLLYCDGIPSHSRKRHAVLLSLAGASQLQATVNSRQRESFSGDSNRKSRAGPALLPTHAVSLGG